MKIIAITSSPSKNGNTALLAGECLSAAKEPGAEVKEIWLPGEKLLFCMECLASGRCPLPDSIESIRKKKTYPFQHIFKRILKYLVLKPIFRKNIRRHKDNLMQAVYQYHTNRKL